MEKKLMTKADKFNYIKYYIKYKNGELIFISLLLAPTLFLMITLYLSNNSTMDINGINYILDNFYYFILFYLLLLLLNILFKLLFPINMLSKNLFISEGKISGRRIRKIVGIGNESPDSWYQEARASNEKYKTKWATFSERLLKYNNIPVKIIIDKNDKPRGFYLDNYEFKTIENINQRYSKINILGFKIFIRKDKLLENTILFIFKLLCLIVILFMLRKILSR
mgnify:CR=1 FL=1